MNAMMRVPHIRVVGPATFEFHPRGRPRPPGLPCGPDCARCREPMPEIAPISGRRAAVLNRDYELERAEYRLRYPHRSRTQCEWATYRPDMPLDWDAAA